MTITSPNPETERLVKRAVDVYSKLPGNRAYALDEASSTALGALAQAHRENGGSLGNADGDPRVFDTRLIELGEVMKTTSDKFGAGTPLFQIKPGDAPPTPKPWIDPVTNQPLENPFLN